MNKFLLALAAATAAVILPAPAADDDSAVRERIAKSLEVSKDNVRASAVPGLYEVQHDHEFGYVTADGKFMIQGDLVNLQTGEQITEAHRRGDRLAALNAFGEKNMIVFAPSPPIATKYTVTVFTDVDCGYCRKLHSQIADYNAQGIAVRYLFWPRSGPNTDSWYRAESVWCSDDRRAMLTKAKSGRDIPARKCDNPVAKSYQMGTEFGLRGTPMLVMPNGDIWPGYLPPGQLAQHLAALEAVDKKVAVGKDGAKG